MSQGGPVDQKATHLFRFPDDKIKQKNNHCLCGLWWTFLDKFFLGLTYFAPPWDE